MSPRSLTKIFTFCCCISVFTTIVAVLAINNFQGKVLFGIIGVIASMSFIVAIIICSGEREKEMEPLQIKPTAPPENLIYLPPEYSYQPK